MSGKNFFSRFITPCFTVHDRWAWVRALGLDTERFLLVETDGTQVLRALQVHGGFTQGVLEVGDAPDCPTWKLLHLTPTPVLSTAPVASLWEMLFPYPFSLVPLLLKESPDLRLEIYPPSVAEAWIELYRTFRQLEDRFAEAEITLLWVRPPSGGGFAVLAHFVRRRCVRVGTAPHLAELGARYDAGELGAEGLYRHFGTQASFFCLDLTNQAPSSGLPTGALRQLVRSPEPVDFRL